MSRDAASRRVLAIDAGNTRIKWGIHDQRWLASGSIPTAEAAGIASAWDAAPGAGIAIASNVAGPAVAKNMQQACERIGLALRFIASQPAQLGVTSGYADPGQLGTDRWAALVAAHHSGRGHKLVVNAGTALTIDALTDEGRFLGGVIVPGPALMRRSLDRGTAGLRLTEGAFDPLPKSTPDAITTGAIQAAVGAIERQRAAMTQAGFAPARALVSGGAAAEIAPHLSLAHAIHENLVLDGLVLICRD